MVQKRQCAVGEKKKREKDDQIARKWSSLYYVQERNREGQEKEQRSLLSLRQGTDVGQHAKWNKNKKKKSCPDRQTKG